MNLNINQVPFPLNHSINMEMNTSFSSKNVASSGGNINLLKDNANIATSTKLSLITSDLDKIQDQFVSISSPVSNCLEENQKSPWRSSSKRFLEEDIKNSDFDDKIAAV